ncbi:MAG: patatin-like phospholipase family protein [Thalassotalea sp.]
MKDHHKIFDEEIADAELSWLKKRRIAAGLADISSAQINGLALSGGGIRSAVFNLGVMQALEKHQKLKQVDVLSSVSGGGYIATALTWFKAKLPKQFPFGSARSDHNKLGGSVINWFRSHSSFLTPGDGISTLSLFTAILTGTLINLLILLPITIFAIYLAIYPLDFLPQPLQGNTFELLHYGSIGLIISSLAFMIITALSTCVSGLKNKKTEQLRKCVTWLFSWSLLLQLVSLIPHIHRFFEQVTQWVVHASLSVSMLGAVMTWLSSRANASSTMMKILLLNIGLLLSCFGFFVLAYHYALDWYDSPYHYLHHIFSGLIVLSLILAMTCNINLISMHGYYRNRLRDAFMPYKLPECNQFPVQEVASWHDAQACYLAELPNNDAPLQIINCNVELTGSKQPKYRNRAGDCFTFTPLFCGSSATGFTTTKDYQSGKMDLATACAISGAAVATNTSKTRLKTLNFILGLLNLRLGCWLPNPAQTQHQQWHLKPLWYLYMFRDMFGAGLNEQQRYIHLSDGGHFENLGVYELVRRKCQTIMSVDAGADPNFLFNDLAKLTELIRVDFGAQLNIDTSQLVPDEKGNSFTAYTVGEIIYNCGTKAEFIYLKATMLENLSADVLGYKKQNPSFPDQSTVDQFFDEFQFEAYRELGFQISHNMLKQQPQLFN